MAEWPPRIPVAAGALLSTSAGRLLLLRPTYKPTWTVPGGCVEPGESPLAACLREVAEETGLRRGNGRLRCVDHRAPAPGHEGGLRFLFDLGELTGKDVDALRLPPEEIAEFMLADPEQACRLVDDAQAARLRAVFNHPAAVLYLEDGTVPSRRAG